MKALLLIGLSLGLCAQSFAQTEASMCKIILDACCDLTASTADYTVPTGQQISKSYVYSDNRSGNQVTVQCWQIIGGSPTILMWELTDLCGCTSAATTTNHPITTDTDLRFKVLCNGCESEDCNFHDAKVYIYTSATSTTCPQYCEPE